MRLFFKLSWNFILPLIINIIPIVMSIHFRFYTVAIWYTHWFHIFSHWRTDQQCLLFCFGSSFIIHFRRSRSENSTWYVKSINPKCHLLHISNEPKLSFCQYLPVGRLVIGSHQMIPHWTTAVIPIELGVVDIMIILCLLFPRPKPTMSTKREYDQA